MKRDAEEWNKSVSNDAFLEFLDELFWHFYGALRQVFVIKAIHKHWEVRKLQSDGKTSDEQHLSIFRIFWSILMAVALGVFCFLMSEMTSKFIEDKIILELSREEFPIKDVPFPAITMCPQVFEKSSGQSSFAPSDEKLKIFLFLTKHLENIELFSSQWCAFAVCWSPSRLFSIHRRVSQPNSPNSMVPQKCFGQMERSVVPSVPGCADQVGILLQFQSNSAARAS